MRGKQIFFLLCTVIALWIFCDFACHSFSADSSARWKVASIIPDSLEYVYAPLTYINTGHYGIPVNGELHPSRYLPWYSLLFIAPFQKITQLNGAVYGVWAGNLLFLLAFFFATYKITRNKFYALSALFLLIFSDILLRLTGIAMTEFPYMGFSALLLLIFTHMYECKSVPALWEIELIGILGALAGAMRSSGYLLLLLPALFIFIRSASWPKRLLNLVLFGIWPLVIILMTIFHNNAIFGTPLRSGYHYWCPVPYEIPGLTFSFRYLLPNLRMMLNEGWFYCAIAELVIIAIWAIFRLRKHTANRPIIDAASLFAGYHIFCLFALYAGYFYYDGRFFLPGVITAIPATLAIFAVFIQYLYSKCISNHPWTLPRFVPYVSCICALILLTCAIVQAKRRIPVQSTVSCTIEEEAFKLLDQTLPDDAVFLSPFLPVKADFHLNLHKHRTLIPYSRKMEYASKIIALEPVNLQRVIPLPTNPFDHQTPALLNADGCRYAIPLTLEDSHDVVSGLLSAGRRVFFLLQTANASVPFSYSDALQLKLIKADRNLRIFEVTSRAK